MECHRRIALIDSAVVVGVVVAAAEAAVVAVVVGLDSDAALVLAG